MTPKIRLTLQLDCQAAPAQLFDAWLDPAQLRRWLPVSLRQAGLSGELVSVEVDARPGGRFLLSDLRDGGEARHWGTYQTLDRPSTLAFTWIVDQSGEADPSLVTILFEPAAAGTHVTLTHEMDAAWEPWLPQTEAGWTRMLRASDALFA